MRYLLPLLRSVLPLIAVGVLGCGDSRTPPTGLLQVQGEASLSTAADLATEINALISSGFSGGTQQAITSRWDNVVRQHAREPNGTLSNGTKGPAFAARKQLVELTKFLDSKTALATPPAGETKAHFVARLVLNMSLYIYSGPSTPPPVLSATSDVVAKLVQPATTDTVVTPASLAAAIFPAGAVSEPTLVVITPVETYYPANCSGPLDTGLCQYPLFYHINIFPHVKLNLPAKVQLCHVDAGVHRLPLADHDRFRLAHEKPANPANYSAGSTIVDNIEIFAYTLMGVTKCTDGGGTVYTPPPSTSAANVSPVGKVTEFAYRAAHRALFAAKDLLTPSSVYAIDVGGGGLVEDFSIFGTVDPLGQADIAQSTDPSTGFRLLQTVAAPGDLVTIPSWQVRNGGSRTSGAFTSSVRFAPDSLMNSPIVNNAVGGAASLVPVATYTYAATTITIPSGTAPGVYFIGTVAQPATADSTPVNNRRSVRITVAALEGSLSGIVRSAFTDVALSGATITAGTRTATSNADGSFMITGVPAGTMNVVATAPGYVSSTRTAVAVVAGQTTSLGTISLTPVALATQIRIVLEWGGCSISNPPGNAPCDLDSHLSGPTATASRFHVYYGAPSFDDAASTAVLDVDDTNGNGPETVTISKQSAGTYQYYVHNYSGSPAITGSSALVRVFLGASLTPAATFNVPTTGSGNGWHVFSLSGGAITSVNTLISMSPSTVLSSWSAPSALHSLGTDLQRIINDISNTPKASSAPAPQSVRQP